MALISTLHPNSLKMRKSVKRNYFSFSFHLKNKVLKFVVALGKMLPVCIKSLNLSIVENRGVPLIVKTHSSLVNARLNNLGTCIFLIGNFLRTIIFRILLFSKIIKLINKSLEIIVIKAIKNVYKNDVNIRIKIKDYS